MSATTESQDVGGILALEHVNIEIPDHIIASIFFCEGKLRNISKIRSVFNERSFRSS